MKSVMSEMKGGVSSIIKNQNAQGIKVEKAKEEQSIFRQGETFNIKNLRSIENGSAVYI
jgi:hypothetical protein